MRADTKKKIERVKKAIKEGKDETEVYRISKSKSKSVHKEFMEKYHNLIFEVETEVIEPEGVPWEGEVPLPVAPQETIIQLLSDKKHISNLEWLLKNTDNIRQGLNTEKAYTGSQDVEVLQIPKEFIKIDDLVLKSVRISKELEKNLNKIVDNYTYTKTSILNYAIKEFIERYKS